mgnify:CR=1 FL=1
MPPWHIDKSVGVQKFKNDMSLSDDQMDTIVRLGRSGRASKATRPTCPAAKPPVTDALLAGANATATARRTSS